MKPKTLTTLYWRLTTGFNWRLLVHRWMPTRPGSLLKLNPRLLT